MTDQPPQGQPRPRRRTGGYGTGEGAVGLVEPDENPVPCRMCPSPAVLYFVDSAEQEQQYACLAHAGAVAYDVAVTSTASPDVPAGERGADDRRHRQ